MTSTGPFHPRSETKDRFNNKPLTDLRHSGEGNKASRKTNFELGYGPDQDSKTWCPEQGRALSSHLNEKYALGTPSDFSDLAKELRKSNIPIGISASRSTGSLTRYRSEFKDRFATHHVPKAPSFMDTLGKDLRSSHIDFANGGTRTANPWLGVASEDMAKNFHAKFGCEKPTALADLVQQVRKSSVLLGQDKVEYTRRADSACFKSKVRR